MAMNTPTVGHPRRKNGRDASCEPCRKSKIRCDHARPICSRCRQRSMHSQCYYHPSPLSKKKIAVEIDQPDTAMDTTTSRLPAISEYTPATAVSSNDERLALKSLDSHPSIGRPDHGMFNRTRAEYAARLAEILRHLRDFERIRDLMTSYWPVSQSAILPEPLIMSGIPILEQTIVNVFGSVDGGDGEEYLERCAAGMLESTSKRIKITAALSLQDFMALFTGENLRLEYLGLVFSIVTRSYLFGLGRDGAQEKKFVRDMYDCSTTCLQLAREVTPINDMMLWLAQDHGMLTSVIEGDSSEITWRRLTEHQSDMFVFGIDTESFVTADTPFFLAECRRRTFARAYRNDKYVASLLDRPPRLLTRRATVQMPLDLSDQELLAGPEELAVARSQLSPDGWSSRSFHSSTWARIRFVIAVMVEKIFEYRWLTLTPEHAEELRALTEKHREIWKSLPTHLQYDPQCWQSIDPQNCFLLVSVFLAFLHTEFLIFQMLEKIDSEAGQRIVLVSAEILSLILELASYRRKAVYMHARVSDVILYNGIAPALVLSQALSKSKSAPSNLPNGIRRPPLIRNLASFVSLLESVSGPGEANYEMCANAAQMITATLDEVLEAAEAPPSSTASNTLSTPVDFEMAEFSPDIPGIWEGFDMSDWQRNFDWNLGYDCF